jgi:hypothetical protein
MADTAERSEVWWLAEGSSSYSRQPSFAPVSARPVVTASYYRFGWYRSKSCFITTRRHDVLSRADTQAYPCERKMALCMLWLCGRSNIAERFFRGYYVRDDDRDVFVAAGYLFGLMVRGFDAEASLHFYSPQGQLQRISLHNGMTHDFKQTIKGMPVRTIYNNLC